MKNSNFEFKTLQNLASYAIDKLKDGIGSNSYGCDLHHELFNTDYFIIGYYDAEKWINENTGVFNAMGIIKDYETDNFGEVNTDLSSSESVCNMLAYIGGEEVLSESKTLQKNWDVILTDKNIQAIIKELKKEFNLS